VADKLNNRIRKIDASTGLVLTFAGSSTSGFRDGTGSSALFNGPSHIVIDSADTLYVSDSGNKALKNSTIHKRYFQKLQGFVWPKY
jgi:hypothetical protein